MQNDLVVGKKYKISMNFISILNDDLIGFYRSSYEESGITKYKSCERTHPFFILTTRICFDRYLAVSQFEAPDARRAFPCFDEPNMKAVYTITVGYKDSMSAISNMPLNRTEPMSGIIKIFLIMT